MIATQYFLLGASFMFSSAIAWIFWRKPRTMLSQLVMALMIVMAIGFLKDTLLMDRLSSLPEFILELATAIDVIAVPLYACILVELCRPGKLTFREICLCETPFVILPLLLAISGIAIFYYIDMILAVVLGLVTATWTCFAIPRYHKHLKNSFSYDDNINLNWLKSILWAFFILLTVWVLSCISYNPWLDVAYMVCTLMLWIFICFFIYKHKSVVNELRPFIKTEITPTGGIRSEVFARIKRLIEEEQIYLNPLLKLSDIAKSANTNRTYASAYFKTEVNATFYDHINGLRVKHAMSLLSDKSKRLDEIAEQSGFNSIRSFHRVFLSINGATPQDYRNAAQRIES